jgi:uncharacterized protein YdhG (YjbR/CyaY superfamily)
LPRYDPGDAEFFSAFADVVAAYAFGEGLVFQRWGVPVKSSLSLSKHGAMQASLEVRKYLAALPADARRQVQKLREAIRAAAPGAVESFGYGMPAFALYGKPFVWYAGWKQHCGFYPLSQATARAFAAEVAGYEISGKGTIRFRLDAPLPTALVKRLVKARIAELRRKQKKS